MRKAKVYLTVEQKQEIADAVNLRGETILDVAYRYNASSSAVSKILRDAGKPAPVPLAPALPEASMTLLNYLTNNGITDTTSFINVTNELATAKARKIFNDLSAEEKLSWLTGLGETTPKIKHTCSVLTDFETTKAQGFTDHEYTATSTTSLQPLQPS